MSTKMAASANDRVSAAFKQLEAFAPSLNSVSDEFSKAISPIESALKRLKLGVPAWHRFDEWQDGGSYSFKAIGYDKVDGSWCIALNSVSGHEAYPERESNQIWSFNDAPRMLRVEAVDHLPSLLEELIRRSESVANQIRSKSDYVRSLAASIPSSPAVAGRK